MKKIEEIALERELNELYTIYENLKQQLSVEKERRRRAERREESLWELLRRRVKDNVDLINNIEVLRMRRYSGTSERRGRSNWHGERDEHYPVEYPNGDRNMQMRDSSREQEYYDIGQHRKSANASEKADKPRRNRERENEQRVKEGEQRNKASDRRLEQDNYAPSDQISQGVSEVAVDRTLGSENEKRKTRIPLPQLPSLMRNNRPPRMGVHGHRDTY